MPCAAADILKLVNIQPPVIARMNKKNIPFIIQQAQTRIRIEGDKR